MAIATILADTATAPIPLPYQYGIVAVLVTILAGVIWYLLKQNADQAKMMWDTVMPAMSQMSAALSESASAQSHQSAVLETFMRDAIERELRGGTRGAP